MLNIKIDKDFLYAYINFQNSISNYDFYSKFDILQGYEFTKEVKSLTCISSIVELFLNNKLENFEKLMEGLDADFLGENFYFIFTNDELEKFLDFYIEFEGFTLATKNIFIDCFTSSEDLKADFLNIENSIAEFSTKDFVENKENLTLSEFLENPSSYYMQHYEIYDADKDLIYCIHDKDYKKFKNI